MAVYIFGIAAYTDINYHSKRAQKGDKEQTFI